MNSRWWGQMVRQGYGTHAVCTSFQKHLATHYGREIAQSYQNLFCWCCCATRAHAGSCRGGVLVIFSRQGSLHCSDGTTQTCATICATIWHKWTQVAGSKPRKERDRAVPDDNVFLCTLNTLPSPPQSLLGSSPSLPCHHSSPLPNSAGVPTKVNGSAAMYLPAKLCVALSSVTQKFNDDDVTEQPEGAFQPAFC